MPVAPRCRTCGHDPRRLDRMTAFLHRGAPLLTALVALRCSSAGLSAQEQTPTIRTETAGVVVDVIVTDHKGRHVPGQSAADFRAYENGTLQTIASFAPPTRHGEPVANLVVGPTAQVNPSAHPPAKTGPPQLITLLTDLGVSTRRISIRLARSRRLLRKNL